MSAIWKNHASRLHQYLKDDNTAQAQVYLEQLMLFPVDIQDKIINDISNLPHCNCEAIAEVMQRYTMFELH
ncbi:hypothetical protein [Thalassotalea piscium]|uniref:Uncharacterized protein n=1 Tax=Thalassotalea piscium TaxID=1230533 RepID=A0A7X0NF65_9GAMM|nr:hypothetical protein [Thalassotalea piscium]MBB6542166.1 hypothetical protein [Thalassotalea piscium]